MTERERLKVDTKPVKLRIESEPYAKFLGRKYTVLIDVFDLKHKREYSLNIEPLSLSQPIHELITAEGSLKNIEVWISKESDEKYAKYDFSIA